MAYYASRLSIDLFVNFCRFYIDDIVIARIFDFLNCLIL